MPKFTIAHYAAIVSTLAFVGSGVVGVYFAKQTYNLNAAKEDRELREKLPAIDVQVRLAGVSTAAIIISVLNRADVNITPLDITVEHSFEIGDLYLSSAKQSIDLLKSALSLSPMGPVVPKGVGTLKATLSGVTDGKDDTFTPGLEFRFAVRIRFADAEDTVKTFPVARRILPPSAVEPCPPSWTLAPPPPGC
jgi:hypothetical protein